MDAVRARRNEVSASGTHPAVRAAGSRCSPARLACALLLIATLSACGGGDRVVLLPDAKGKVGKVFVKGKNGDTLLTSAYGSANISGGGRVEQVALNREQVDKDFGAVLGTLPPPPASYYLYFIEGSEQLNDESSRRVLDVLADIAKRPGAEVVVIGHTDTVGKNEDNDELSLRRAGALRDQLLLRGFDAAHVSVAGRGERDLLVPTPDETTEPRNRYAEINVR